MKITFYDEESYNAFVATIREEYFAGTFDLFGQRVRIHNFSASVNCFGGIVELDIVQVA